MRTKLAAVYLLIALVAASWSQPTGDGWNKFSSAEGKFSVLFPGQPVESSTTLRGVQVHTFKVLQNSRTYMLVYVDYSDAVLHVDAATRLNAERDSFLNTVSGKLVSEREYKFKKGSAELPALEFNSESTSRTFRVRVILDGSRVYLLGTGIVKGVDSTREFERFLGSFSLN